MLVEVEACLVPFQSAEIEHAASLRFLIRHDVLVLHIEECTCGQNLAPMSHQTDVINVIASQLRQIVSLVLLAVEQSGETGEAGIHRITVDVNNFCIGQHQMNQADREKVGRHLVGDVFRLRRALAQS